MMDDEDETRGRCQPRSGGERATLTKVGGRDGGPANEGCEVDRLVQPARAANGFWLDTTTGAKWDDRFYEPSEGEA